jgi:sortase A
MGPTMETVEATEAVPSRRHRPRAGRLLIIGGAVLFGIGVLALAGLSVYVWYTNNYARNQQKKLAAEWKEKPLPVTRIANATVAPGAPVAQIIVPRMNLVAIVVELAGMDDRANLNRGPGHVPGTAYPGMPGNVFIAGHRTTYGAPFGPLDQMRNGDKIILVTAEGKHIYTVYEQRIVDPHDLSVLNQEGEPRVTLMACHPKFTARQRLLVIGRLSGESSP